MLPSLRRLLAGVVSLSIFGVFSARGDAHKWDLSRFSPDTAALYKAASGVTPAAGADVVVLDDEENYVFDAEGRIVHARYLAYKVLTPRGAEGWSGTSLLWEPWHENRPRIRARVITADDEVHPLDPKTITDAPARADQNDIYSDQRVVQAPFPAISPGSVVEEEEIWDESKSVFATGTVKRFYFGRVGVPVQRVRLVLDSPASLPVRYELQLLPDLKPERTEENGRVRIAFEYGPVPALEQAEGQLPSDVPAYPNLTFSTGTSWQQMAQEYGKIVDTQIAAGDVQSLTAKLIAGKESREDKATAVLQYLDREVRYTGVEFGDAAITPRSPAETLKRKYGDCKDKAALLVAMLRAAGVPAYIALLNAGDRQDVAPDLPGMGLFDHAIVYAPGSPDFWVDATDEYARLGPLPSGDQGRMALVARAESKSLVLTPAASSQDNLLVEKREFYLAEYGPARIVETSVPHGRLESRYRSAYGNPENKDRREELTNYVKAQYLAEKLNRFAPSDPLDITKQFTLVLEAGSGKRGFTDLEMSVAAIRLETIFSGLPAELQEREEEADKNTKAAEEQPKKTRSADYQLEAAFATEWQYRIVPPPGFRPKPLPPNAKLALGPAVLTEEFSADKDGVVHAVIRFDTVKRRFSVSEATEMRGKIAELREGAPIFVYFEPIAQALLNEGKIRESFETYRNLIALHPNEAIHHLQIAEALLSAGMGQAARNEAQRAVRLQPDSALAQKTLADILEYDLVGRKLQRGSDYAGAEAAFRAAKKLDPDDKSIVANLAVLLEYNGDGERYGPGAKLKESVAEYQSLTPDQLNELGVKNNLALTLFYARDFSAARTYAEGLNPQLTAVIVASEAALSGPQTGIAEASKRTGGEDERKQVLKTAGEMLMRARIYPAADLLEAGASGENASNTMGLASVLRKARRHEEIHFNEEPSEVAMQSFLTLADPGVSLEKMMALSSRNAREVMKRTDQEELDRVLRSGRELRRELARTGFPADVMLDVMMQLIEPKVEGDDASGYRVTLRVPGSSNIVVYVVKEDGKYKILDSSTDPNSIGLEILDRIAANNLTGARVLLDWLRDEQHLAGGDDPLAREVFPRMWTKGKEADAAHMKLAAAAILVQTKPTAQQGVSILEAANNSAASDTDKLNISLALISGYRYLDDFEKVLALSSALARQYPESLREFWDQGFALRGLGKFADADALAHERLKLIPEDLDAQRALVISAYTREDYALAHELSLKVVNSRKAQSSDLNLLAWLALFTGKVSGNDTESAIKAAQLSQNRSAAILHTLGCLYAEVGKTKEAREILIQAMDQLSLDEPDSNYWYAFGRIAEQYGETDVARADYAQVKKPKRAMEVPDSSYRLAQNRLKILGGDSKGSSSTKN